MGDVKLTDGGANTVTFPVDSIREYDLDFDKYERMMDASLKHYNIGQKKRWDLIVRSVTNANKNTLRTIYNLRSTLSFYRDSTDGAATATVIWRGGFNLDTPTNESHQMLTKFYKGTITLEQT